MQWVMLSVFIAAMLHVCVYGVHRYILLYLYRRYASRRPIAGAHFAEWPHVTVQLPMYNERFVAERVIEAAAALDYPHDRLHIQVLDDSTDGSRDIALATVERLAKTGIDVTYHHRTDRTGYKAGALAEGLRAAVGELIAVFDADFLPNPEFLKETVHHFTDPKVGMVQARWAHINREDSLLTRAQAVLLDGHFVMEHGARWRSGRFMSFNGTAGIWRKTCIEDAGGWQHDTLTEDLDLSYRAQLRGWKFVYLQDLTCPAELPPEMRGFKSQQHRWAKGGAQTCRKLLPAVMRASLSWRVKLEAFYHLTGNTAYVSMMVIVLLLGPIIMMGCAAGGGGGTTPNWWAWMVDAGLLLVATCSVSAFYVVSQRELARTWRQSLRPLPVVMTLGVGIALNNARASLEGFFGPPGEFVRTPKYGVDGIRPRAWRRRARYVALEPVETQALVELAIGLYLTICVALCLSVGWVGLGLPFMILFAVGYLYVGWQSLESAKPVAMLLRRWRRRLPLWPAGHAAGEHPSTPSAGHS